MTHIQAYEDFCRIYNRFAWPLNKKQVCIFLTFVALQGNAYHTVRNYFYSINEWQQLLGEEPILVTGILKATLNGIKKSVRSVLKQASPLTVRNLSDMSEFVDLTKQEQVAAWTAILVGFNLMLRKSNLVPEQVRRFSPDHQLTRDDVEIEGDFEI